MRWKQIRRKKIEEEICRKWRNNIVRWQHVLPKRKYTIFGWNKITNFMEILQFPTGYTFFKNVSILHSTIFDPCFSCFWEYFQQAYFPPQIHISIISVQRMLCVNENCKNKKQIRTHCHNYLKIYRCLNCKCIELKISRKHFKQIPMEQYKCYLPFFSSHSEKGQPKVFRLCDQFLSVTDKQLEHHFTAASAQNTILVTSNTDNFRLEIFFFFHFNFRWNFEECNKETDTCIIKVFVKYVWRIHFRN